MIKKVLSFFLPINILKRKSTLSKSLEVTWSNGELVLDSLNTNYSYGSLQRILRQGLMSIGFEQIQKMKNILILGVAGGSVIKTLVNEIGSKADITGVEIDAEVINIANTYFGLDRISNLRIVIDDAFDFVLKEQDHYDLIIVDIFQDSTMPKFLFETYFADRLALLLTADGIILFNTMILSDDDELRNQTYLKSWNTSQYLIKTIPRVEKHNEVIIIKKKS